MALKIIKREAMDLKDYFLYRSEIESLRICTHKNIIGYVDSFSTNDYLFLVTEFAEGKSLSSSLQAGHMFTESEIKAIIKDLLQALHHISSLGFVHRDIKPENIFVSETKTQLIDFNLAIALSPNGKCSRFAGSLPYMAPEVLMELPYDFAADMWSLGIVAHLLLLGKMPYPAGASAENQKRYSSYVIIKIIDA